MLNTSIAATAETLLLGLSHSFCLAVSNREAVQKYSRAEADQQQVFDDHLYALSSLVTARLLLAGAIHPSEVQNCLQRQECKEGKLPSASQIMLEKSLN